MFIIPIHLWKSKKIILQQTKAKAEALKKPSQPKPKEVEKSEKEEASTVTSARNVPGKPRREPRRKDDKGKLAVKPSLQQVQVID